MEKKLGDYLTLNCFFETYDSDDKITGEYSEGIYKLLHNKYMFKYSIKEIKENKMLFFHIKMSDINEVKNVLQIHLSLPTEKIKLVDIENPKVEGGNYLKEIKFIQNAENSPVIKAAPYFYENFTPGFGQETIGLHYFSKEFTIENMFLDGIENSKPETNLETLIDFARKNKAEKYIIEYLKKLNEFRITNEL